jgi:hypothetical protein
MSAQGYPHSGADFGQARQAALRYFCTQTEMAKHLALTAGLI